MPSWIFPAPAAPISSGKNPRTRSPGALVLADDYSRIGDIATAAGRKRLVHLDRVDHGSPGVDPAGPCSMTAVCRLGASPTAMASFRPAFSWTGRSVSIWDGTTSTRSRTTLSGAAGPIGRPQSGESRPPAEPRLPTDPDPDARTDTGRIRGHLFPPGERSSRRGAAAGRAPDPVPAHALPGTPFTRPNSPWTDMASPGCFSWTAPANMSFAPGGWARVGVPSNNTAKLIRNLAPHGRQPSLHPNVSRWRRAWGGRGAGNQDFW